MYEVWRFVLCCDWVEWKVYGEFWWDGVGVYWKNGWGIGWNWFCIWGVMVMMYFYDNIWVFYNMVSLYCGVLVFVVYCSGECGWWYNRGKKMLFFCRNEIWYVLYLFLGGKWIKEFFGIKDKW